MPFTFTTAAQVTLRAVVDALCLVYPDDGETLDGYSAMVAAHNVDLARSPITLDETGAVAGMVLLGMRDRRGWCCDVAVVPSHQNRGLGQALMRRADAEAARAGLRALQLEVRDDNAPARHVYEKNGYRYTRRLPCYIATLDGLGWRYMRSPSGLTVARDESGDAVRRWHGTRFVAAPPWERELPSLLARRNRAAWTALSDGREVACLACSWPDDRRRLNIDLLALTNDTTHTDVRVLAAAAMRETGIETLRMGLEPADSRAAVMLREFGFRVDKDLWEMIKNVPE
ncbi:MAG: GNAT family N-acetyltransferase [Chloroflexi bacterium]|nr:GNAT family N-acetyltransferase [Chloroflexota bacterium]